MEREYDTVHERLPGASLSRRKTIWLGITFTIAIGMFVFAYANAQYFVMLCQEMGLLSQDPTKTRSEIADAPKGRSLEVYFSAHVADNLPIAFEVDKGYQATHINEAKINDYRFRNLSDQTIYFRPVHDINPVKAGAERILILEQCFCFTEQKLEPGQRYTLPVKYTFSDKLPENVYNIKMNYTLFASTKEQYEASIKAYAQGGTPAKDTESN